MLVAQNILFFLIDNKAPTRVECAICTQNDSFRTVNTLTFTNASVLKANFNYFISSLAPVETIIRTIIISGT